MKRLIMIICVIALLCGCGKETMNTPTTQTPQKDPYGVYEEILLKEEFSDRNYKIALYPDGYERYSVDYIPIDAYEDETFMIDAFYLNLMEIGHGDIDPQMMINDYDYSWLDDTKTANHKIVNSDGSVIDPYAIINNLKDDTILYQEVEIHEFDDDDKRIDIDGDPNIEKEAIYRTDEEWPFSVGVYYKDAYIDEVLSGDLSMFGPSLNGLSSSPKFNFGRWYKVFIDDGNTLSIKLDSYLDGTLVTFDLTDNKSEEPKNYKVEMYSDVDIKDVAGYGDVFEDFTFNFKARLADDSSLQKGITASEDDLLSADNYVHEDVLFKDVYEGAYVNGQVDVKVSTYEDATFMLDDMIFGYGFKYFYYSWPHNEYLAEDMYVRDYDRTWVDDFVKKSGATGWDMTKAEGDVDPLDAVNHFKDDTILFTDGLLIYDFIDGDKIIRESAYTSNKYGYGGNVTVGIRYEDSYLKEIFEHDIKRADLSMAEVDERLSEANVLRKYRVAPSETSCLTFTVFDDEDRSLVIFEADYEHFVFSSDFDLKGSIEQ